MPDGDAGWCAKRCDLALSIVGKDWCCRVVSCGGVAASRLNKPTRRTGGSALGYLSSPLQG